MPVHYVKVIVAIHNLDAESAEAVCQDIGDVLSTYFGMSDKATVSVELVESAGSMK